MRNPHARIATGVWHSTYQLREPEEFSYAVAGATLRADFLSPRTSAAQIERYVGTSWAFDFFKAGVKARVSGPLMPNWVALCLVLRGGLSRWYGQDVAEGTLLCNPPGVGIEGCIAPDFMGVSISVPMEVWEECRLLAGSAPEAINGFRAIPLPPQVYQNARRALEETRGALSALRLGPGQYAVPSMLGDRLARELATAAWAHVAAHRPAMESTRNRFRLARRAEDWMKDHIHEPFGMPDVCLSLGVSRRELEYAFRSAFAESPRAYLESLRMNAVRAALHSAGEDASVTSIALSHGFNHLGRFSTRYHAFFGHRPSEALTRSRHIAD